MHLQAYDLSGILETWWDGWSVVMDGYRWAKEEDRAALYVREQWECLELYLGLEEEPGENLCQDQ